MILAGTTQVVIPNYLMKTIYLNESSSVAGHAVGGHTNTGPFVTVSRARFLVLWLNYLRFNGGARESFGV